MTVPVSETILTAFVVGLVMGIIHGINKKLFMIVWGLAVVSMVVLFFILGPSQYASDLNWGVWNWVAMIVVVNLTFLGAAFMTKEIKEEFFR